MKIWILRGVRRGPLLRLLLLSCMSCLGAVADATLSPYYCPAARKRGISVALCGLVIGSSFITQIIFLLIFGRLMRNFGARKIYFIGVVMSCIFNIIFGTLDWVKDHDLFLVLSFIFVIICTVGDAGVFSSVYVLAAEENIFEKPIDDAINMKENKDDKEQQSSETNERTDQAGEPSDVRTFSAQRSIENPLPVLASIMFGTIAGESSNVRTFRAQRSIENPLPVLASIGATVTSSDDKINTESNVEDLNAFGPAWMETMYACGTMAGPPLGGLLYEYGGFPLTFITTGVFMTITGILTIPAYINRPIFHSSESTQSPANHINILRLPLIFISCLVMITSGVCSSWYLPSLESFLTTQHSLTPSIIGLIYMVFGIVYTILTPIFGHFIDKGLPHLPLLIFAAFSNILGYLLMAPSPLLSFFPSHISFPIIGLLLIGLGVSGNCITCLSLMSLEAEKSGFGTGEATAGIITSLWAVSELIGGFLGSTVGGFAANSWGFPASTTCVVVVEILILFILITVSCMMHLKT